jgi:hypothetical protein
VEIGWNLWGFLPHFLPQRVSGETRGMNSHRPRLCDTLISRFLDARLIALDKLRMEAPDMAKAATKTYPLRLDHGIAEELEFVATVDGMTVADEVRQAIVVHLENRRDDGEFQERLRMSRERDQSLYERLSADVQQY